MTLARPAFGEEKVQWPANSLIVFGANWCAPCLIELRHLDMITKAAAPKNIFIAWTDGRPAIPASSEVHVLNTSMAKRVFRQLSDRVRGLPANIMTDGQGRICSIEQRPLTPERIGKMKQDCAPPL